MQSENRVSEKYVLSRQLKQSSVLIQNKKLC